MQAHPLGPAVERQRVMVAFVHRRLLIGGIRRLVVLAGDERAHADPVRPDRGRRWAVQIDLHDLERKVAGIPGLLVGLPGSQVEITGPA